MPLSPDDILGLKAKHGPDLRGLQFDDATVVLRAPKAIEYRCFQDRAKDPDARLEALEEIAKGCIVSPVGDELETFLQKKPGALVTCGGVVLEMAGISDKVRVQKL